MAPPTRRRIERIAGVAQCKTCERVARGVTTREFWAWQGGTPHREYHFCDDCRAGVEPRPLEAAIDDLVDGW